MQKRASDHPRACGANDFLIAGANVGCGSSPRVRGKRPSHVRKGFRKRIIPARAGQTCSGSGSRRAGTDHPRACGANPRALQSVRAATGSSPRVRGKRGGRPHARTGVRIIPARAGQTPQCPQTTCPYSDHPRACGANYCSARLKSRAHGSSPRVRGKPDRVVRVPDVGRIIPARAGQTVFRGQAHRQVPDHPRACGANPVTVIFQPSVVGSSPRVRGKPCRQVEAGHRRRIIPARAGQTLVPFWFPVSDTDHPRACGANASGSAST